MEIHSRKSRIFKCRIETDETGRVSVTSYSNRMIDTHLHSILNDAVHDGVEFYNGDAPWKKPYIRMVYDGKEYEQVDQKDKSAICGGCVFHTFPQCQHPYYLSGTKGKCTGKIYKEVIP